ncbi:MAG TPA: hypothetical protein DCR55_05645 [Lentisphaeria bacterium]|nr:hypothetical protein [Lentisphaeria bacterium]
MTGVSYRNADVVPSFKCTVDCHICHETRTSAHYAAAYRDGFGTSERDCNYENNAENGKIALAGSLVLGFGLP